MARVIGHSRRSAALAAGVALALTAATLSACGVTRGDDERDLAMMIPNSPGGGYDQTGRAAVSVMEQEDITGGSFEVTNIIGAGGSVAMTRLMNAEGDENTMMTAGLGVVGSLYSFGLDYQLQDATPLAQLMEDQEGVLVPADSPFKTIDDFVEAWQEDPGGVVVGGGSSPGGPDHLFPMQLAEAHRPRPQGRPLRAVRRGWTAHQRPAGQQDPGRVLRPRRVRGPDRGGELRALAVSGRSGSPESR